MKIANKYIRQSGAFLLAMLLLVSCAEFEEYTSTTYGSGPTVTLSLVSVQDYSITVAVTSSASGYATVALFKGTGNTVPDSVNLVRGNVSSLDKKTAKTVANEPTQFTFSTDLVQDTEYELMAAANNADGKLSKVVTLTVKTDDTNPPVLLETDPPSSYSAVLEDGAPITLYFDEPVVYDQTKEFIFSTLYTGMSVAAEDVVVSGKAVAVYPPDIPQGEYVMLSWPEGVVTDASGNPAEEMVSEYIADEGIIVGVYTRRVRPPRAPVSVEPAADSIASGAAIVITYDNVVTASSSISQDMIILEYYNDEGVFNHAMAVDPTTLVFSGMTVTVPQAYSAPYGWWVDLYVEGGAWNILYGVPCTEISESWRIY